MIDTTDLICDFKNVTELNNEIMNHKGELVIHEELHTIVRLDDVVDKVEDYYWVYNKWVGLKGMYEENDGKFLSTCVCQHIRLKGFIPDKEYNRMLYFWNNNNYVKAI